MNFHFNWVISSLLFSNLCFAEGNKVGNGGDGVFCKDTKPSEGQLLDFYEADVKFKTALKDHNAVVKERFEELQKIAPKLGAQYLNRLKDIESEFDFKSNIELTDIKDSKHLFKPGAKDCEILQIVIRKRSTTLDDKRFLVRQDLWDKLPVTDKAGLISHEIIYEHFMKLGATDSIKARTLNRYLYLDKMDKKKFWDLVQELEIPIYP